MAELIDAQLMCGGIWEPWGPRGERVALPLAGIQERDISVFSSPFRLRWDPAPHSRVLFPRPPSFPLNGNLPADTVIEAHLFRLVFPSVDRLPGSPILCVGGRLSFGALGDFSFSFS